MKSTLLAVLVISLCYYDTPAQSIAPHSPGYIKYQEATSGSSLKNGSKKANAMTDGVASFDKLTNDISAFHTMADGTASTDKLAEILINSLGNFDGENIQRKPALRIMPVVYTQQSTAGNGQYSYERYMHDLMTGLHPLPKPRPITSKKSGWLL
jgi:hypothetical protein